MEIEIFTVCDYAQDMNGKLVIVGTFDAIFAKTFPAVHPSLSIVGRLRFADKEAGNHQFKMSFKNESGVELVPTLDGNLSVSKPLVGNHSTVNIVINLNQIKFDNPGKYNIELFLDGEWKSGLAINIAQQE